MGYRITYYQEVIDDDISALPETIKERVKHAIDDRLITCPELYGKPLRRPLSGYRKLRIGDWRVIYRVQGDEVIIVIIAHRSKVYSCVFQRLTA